MLFSYGFRPFFLLGGAWAPLALSTLLVALGGARWPADALPLFRWHGHEMLFGFVATAIAGFLLTAVPTWTSSRAVSGLPLAGLAALWVAGRVVLSPLFGLHATPAVLLEVLFFPALMLALGIPLLRTRNFRNYPFLLMLTLLFIADVLFHAVHLGWIAALRFDPLRLAANLVLVIIVIVGGRIIPAFTRNALLASGVPSTIEPKPWLERLSLAAVAAVVVGDLAAPDTKATGALAAAAALLLAARLVRWQGLTAVRMPIVFVLHAGYAWLVVALALKASWLLGGIAWGANWLHALTAGAFGTMILAGHDPCRSRAHRKTVGRAPCNHRCLWARDSRSGATRVGRRGPSRSLSADHGLGYGALGRGVPDLPDRVFPYPDRSARGSVLKPSRRPRDRDRVLPHGIVSSGVEQRAGCREPETRFRLRATGADDGGQRRAQRRNCPPVRS
jgi:uncharacterized protein involved in response to NO